MPTDQELQKFWNGLQSALNNAGADINLNSKADIARIRIVDITDKEENTHEFNANVKCRFAFADPDFDIGMSGDEGIIEAQQTGMPSKDKLIELYNAAGEGRLFFNSLNEKKMYPRQIVIDAEGNPEIWPDLNHQTREMTIAPAAMKKPVKPPKPSIKVWTRIKAFFGNKAAKEEIRRKNHVHDQEMIRYNKQLGEYNEASAMDPKFVDRCKNQMYAMINYFQDPDMDAIYRENRLARVFNAGHKDERMNEIRENIDKALSTCQNPLFGEGREPLAQENYKDSKEAAAGLIYLTNVKSKIEREYSKGDIPEEKLDYYAKITDFESMEYRKNILSISQSTAFEKAFGNMKETDFPKDLSDEKATISLCNKLIPEMNEYKSQKLDDVEVKQSAFDNNDILPDNVALI